MGVTEDQISWKQDLEDNEQNCANWVTDGKRGGKDRNVLGNNHDALQSCVASRWLKHTESGLPFCQQRMVRHFHNTGQPRFPELHANGMESKLGQHSKDSGEKRRSKRPCSAVQRCGSSSLWPWQRARRKSFKLCDRVRWQTRWQKY